MFRFLGLFSLRFFCFNFVTTHTQVNTHLLTLQTCLTTLMGHPISMEQLRLDVGHMVEKMTQITIMFRRIKLQMEEYVCLKVYILLNKGMSGCLSPATWLS